MRAAPLGQTSLAPMGPAQANQSASETDLQPRTVTSHSLTLAGRGFRLDFTWRREERDQASQGESAPKLRAAAAQTARYDRNARPVPAPAQPAPPIKASSAAPAARRQSFAEVLKRQQLAGLVMMPSRPPAGRTLLLTPQEVAPPLPGPVCRAYDEALGPLAAPASRLYTA